MKVKHIPAFRKWLKAMCALDKRLDVSDFNKLFRLYRRSAK
jgi:hypothetical protein